MSYDEPRVKVDFDLSQPSLFRVIPRGIPFAILKLAVDAGLEGRKEPEAQAELTSSTPLYPPIYPPSWHFEVALASIPYQISSRLGSRPINKEFFPDVSSYALHFTL